MRITLYAVVVLCLLTAPPTFAADKKLPASVAKDLKEMAGLCSEAGGKPMTDNAVKRVDRLCPPVPAIAASPF